MSKQEPQGSSGSGRGSTLEYFRKVGDLYKTMWEGQIALLKDVALVPPPFAGPNEMSELVRRAANAWGGWFTKLRELVAPGGAAAAAPILAFVVDAHAEMSAVQSVRIAKPGSMGHHASDLFPLGSDQKDVIGREYIQVRLDGSELRVGLVNLGHGKKQRSARGIVPGRYVAVISERAGGEKPLALLDITFLD